MRKSLVMVAVLWALWTATASAQVDQRRISKAALRDAVAVIQGLRDRRLFDLAESYARQSLASESIATIDKATIVLEQIQNSVAEAIVSTGGQRESAWAAAHKTVADFAIQFPDHPQSILVRVQGALVHFSHGNLIQQEIAAEIAPPAARQSALDQFRQSTTAFKAIEREIEKRLPMVANREPTDGGLTALQLTNLKNNIRYRIATINLAKAQLYDASDRLNRMDALNQVLSRLDQVITQSNADLPLWWDAQVARATCLRLKQDGRAFDRLISNLPDADIASNWQQSFLVQRILMAIVLNRSRRFDPLLNEFRQTKNQSAELQLAAIECIMQAAAQQSDGQKQQTQAEALGVVQRIEENHGAYWARRAEVLLVGSVASAVKKGETTSSDFEILIRQGESAFRKDNFSDAARAFKKALQFVAGGNDSERALQVVTRLGQCFEQQQLYGQAAHELTRMARQFRQARLAGAVHLRGCWNLSRASQPMKLIDALREHVSYWPEGVTADQAQLWLGGALQNQQQWEPAIAAYNSISLSSPHAASAIEQIQPCARQWIDSEKKRGLDAKPITRQLVSQIRERLPVARSNENWNDAQRWLLAAMISLSLPDRVMSRDEAGQWLQSARKGQPISEKWRIESLVLRLLVACVDPAADRSVEAVQDLPNDAAVMSDVFNRIRKTLTPQQFAAVAQTRIMICNKAMADAKASDHEFWQIEKLVAQVDGNQAGAALGELGSLAGKYPKSLKIQLAFARALSAGSDKPDKILKCWRKLAAHVPKESEAWYEAKYNVVQQMLANDQHAEANKLVKYLSVTTASWKNSGWSDKFEKLIK